MLEQFPPSELKSYETLRKLFGENYATYKIFDDEFIGYLILFDYSDFIFIDYFAVLKKYHSQGYGTKILAELKNVYSFKKGCFLEVEPPNPEKVNTLKRIKFYTNNGAKKLEINYLYPNKDGYIPLDLYYISYHSYPTNAEIKDFVSALFNYIHRDLKHREKVLAQIFN